MRLTKKDIYFYEDNPMKFIEQKLDGRYVFEYIDHKTLDELETATLDDIRTIKDSAAKPEIFTMINQGGLV